MTRHKSCKIRKSACNSCSRMRVNPSKKNTTFFKNSSRPKLYSFANVHLNAKKHTCDKKQLHSQSAVCHVWSIFKLVKSEWQHSMVSHTWACFSAKRPYHRLHRTTRRRHQPASWPGWKRLEARRRREFRIPAPHTGRERFRCRCTGIGRAQGACLGTIRLALSVVNSFCDHRGQLPGINSQNHFLLLPGGSSRERDTKGKMRVVVVVVEGKAAAQNFAQLV